MSFASTTHACAVLVCARASRADHKKRLSIRHADCHYIGLIATGILISKMTGSSKEEEAVTAVAGDAGPVDMVPSMFSDKFDDFISQPGNEAVFEKSCDEFEEWIKVPGNAAKYEAQFN